MGPRAPPGAVQQHARHPQQRPPQKEKPKSEEEFAELKKWKSREKEDVRHRGKRVMSTECREGAV